MALKCTYHDCGKEYKRMFDLAKHQRKKGHTDEPASGKLLCPIAGCGKRLTRMSELCAHVRTNHNVSDATIQRTSFESVEKFEEWKCDLEKSTSSSFVQHESAKTGKNVKHMYFYCHRSGQTCKATKPIHTRIRAVKSQGLCKQDASCTAHIAATVDVVSGSVAVKFCSHHLSHDTDIGHRRLSTSVRLVMSSEPDDTATCPDSATQADEQVLQQIPDAADTRTDAMRRQLISQCQAIIAKAAQCSNLESLESGVTHTRTAFSSMLALDGGRDVRPLRLASKRKMPPNTKLERQFRFFSTRAKRPKQRLCLGKPRATDIREAKRKLLADEVTEDAAIELTTASNMTLLAEESHPDSLRAVSASTGDAESAVSEAELPPSATPVFVGSQGQADFLGIPFIVDTEEVIDDNNALESSSPATKSAVGKACGKRIKLRLVRDRDPKDLADSVLVVTTAIHPK